MSDNVLMFGAGFSCSAGIPLLRDFVNRMWQFAQKGRSADQKLSGEDVTLFARANEIRQRLDAYHGRATFDDRNIEDVLSILAFNAFAGERGAKESLRETTKAIARTIELCCSVAHPGLTGRRIDHISEEGPEIYRRLWRSLLALPQLPSIITFNYDLVLERSLLQALVGLHYDGYTNRRPFADFSVAYRLALVPDTRFRLQAAQWSHRDGARQGTILETTTDRPQAEIEILKLHGSLNFPSRKYEGKFNFVEAIDNPLILPPIFNKLERSEIGDVWKVAMARLRKAKNIIIVGYSLPRTDVYMQYFLKAALGPNLDLDKIIVFDPVLYGEGNAGNEFRNRFAECFSPQLRNRIYFRPDELTGTRTPNMGSTDHFTACLETHPAALLF